MDRLKCLPKPQQYGHMIYIKHLISELERLTRLDDSLRVHLHARRGRRA